MEKSLKFSTLKKQIFKKKKIAFLFILPPTGEMKRKRLKNHLTLNVRRNEFN